MPALVGTSIKEITEQIGDQFGVTVRYRVFGHYVEFFAAAVTGVGQNGEMYYWLKGASSSNDDMPDFDRAERLVEGSVKWDGCVHYNFGDDNGYLHVCGVNDAQQLADTITTIHRRCGQLMKQAGQELLEDEF